MQQDAEPHLLESLEKQQDEVIDQLERLNRQIEALIAQAKPPSGPAVPGTGVR